MAEGLDPEAQYSVVKLRLALYGYLLSGGYWERHCTQILRSAGVSPVTNWEPTSVHKYLQMILSVYVDDCKMAGPREQHEEGIGAHSRRHCYGRPHESRQALWMWPREAQSGFARHCQGVSWARFAVVISKARDINRCGRRLPNAMRCRRGLRAKTAQLSGGWGGTFRGSETKSMGSWNSASRVTSSWPTHRGRSSRQRRHHLLEERHIPDNDFDEPGQLFPIAAKVSRTQREWSGSACSSRLHRSHKRYRVGPGRATRHSSDSHSTPTLVERQLGQPHWPPHP